jgi:hypothetical protein
MPIHLPGRRAAALIPALIAACLALAACGSSGGSSTSASNTPATGATGARGPGAFTALRQCLARNGINLPQRPAGQRRPGGGAGGGIFGGGGATGGAGPRLPPGVTAQQLQAARQKCGAAGRSGRGSGFANNPAFRQSLTAFATCMRKNGVNLPAPNTSGSGPVFNTKGLDASSPTFTAATAKCRPLLRGGFGGRGGAGGGPPGAPGAGGAAGAGGPTPSSQ